MKPNPDYVNAPYECCGWAAGFHFLACAAEPPPPDENEIWIKMPEGQPMHFKKGKWVPWLNPPADFARCIPGMSALPSGDISDPRHSDC